MAMEAPTLGEKRDTISGLILLRITISTVFSGLTLKSCKHQSKPTTPYLDYSVKTLSISFFESNFPQFSLIMLDSGVWRLLFLGFEVSFFLKAVFPNAH